MRFADSEPPIEWLTTGIASLDTIMGGGVPMRRITEISGRAGLGKSTLALSVVAQAQKYGVLCVWADIEWSFDPLYSYQRGVDLKKLGLIQERYAEAALDEIEAFAEKSKHCLIVLDSIGGLSPRAEVEKGAEGKTIGAQAKLVAVFCRKMVPILAINNSALLVLNHEFKDIMSGRLMTAGGAKLEYHKSLHVSLRKTNKRIMQGDKQVGDVIEAEIRKNKVAPTQKQKCEMSLMYSGGFSLEQDLLAEALEKGVVERRKSSYFFQDARLGVGLAQTREALKDEALAAKIKEML